MTALIWYALITSACAGVAALAGERLLRQLGTPARGVWVAAIALSLALPALVPARRVMQSVTPAVTSSTALSIASLPLRVVTSAPKFSALNAAAVRDVWIVASALVLLVAIGVQLRYLRLRRTWSSETIGGERVLVSGDDGPAVMGFWRPDIVVPRWLLTRGEREQQLVVRHEREHLRGGDPVILRFGLLAVAAMPWNVALWWIVARLRLAAELDCDARVLRAGALPYVYGNLLIDVAELTAGHRVPALALLNPTSHLQRRLIAMHPDRIRFPRVRGTALVAVAAVAVLAACEAALPTDASVAKLDGAKAAQLGSLVMKTVPDSVVYKVDGKIVPKSQALAIPQAELGSANVHSEYRTPCEPGSCQGKDRMAVVELETKGWQASNVGWATTKDSVSGRGYTVKAFDNASSRKYVTVSDLPAKGVDSALAGKVVDVVASPVQPGAEKHEQYKADFTGILFINGVEVPASRLKDLNRESIESVEVIKGPTAQRLYGERGLNGVIRIVTK